MKTIITAIILTLTTTLTATAQLTTPPALPDHAQQPTNPEYTGRAEQSSPFPFTVGERQTLADDDIVDPTGTTNDLLGNSLPVDENMGVMIFLGILGTIYLVVMRKKSKRM